VVPKNRIGGQLLPEMRVAGWRVWLGLLSETFVPCEKINAKKGCKDRQEFF